MDEFIKLPKKVFLDNLENECCMLVEELLFNDSNAKVHMMDLKGEMMQLNREKNKFENLGIRVIRVEFNVGCVFKLDPLEHY